MIKINTKLAKIGNLACKQQFDRSRSVGFKSGKLSNLPLQLHNNVQQTYPCYNGEK